jgi:hypothetical protein
VAIGDVGGLVGEHRLHLVGAVEAHQQPRMDEHVPRIGHEGVERAVVDDDDLRALRQAGLAKDRRGQFPQRALDLGVADDGLGRCRDRGQGHERRQRGRAPSLRALTAIDDPSGCWFDTGPASRIFARSIGSEACGIQADPRSIPLS